MRLYQLLKIDSDKNHISYGIFSSELAVVYCITSTYITGLEEVKETSLKWYVSNFNEWSPAVNIKEWFINELKKIGSLEELRAFFSSHIQRNELWCVRATNQILPFEQLFIFEFELDQISKVEITRLKTSPRNEYIRLFQLQGES